MDDAEELPFVITRAMRRVKPFERVDEERYDHAEGGVVAGQLQEPVQRGTFHVLHDQVVRALGRAPDVLNTDDVWMRDARGDARFVEEHRHELFVVGEVVVDDLHREVTLETGRAHTAAQEDARHPASCDLPQQLVSAHGASTDDPATRDRAKRRCRRWMARNAALVASSVPPAWAQAGARERSQWSRDLLRSDRCSVGP
ncbi:MAG: hypothetical protein MUE69_20705 [Myxococcota bacterium]|nr:hypothetical protein [Myxococcota bacterium]